MLSHFTGGLPEKFAANFVDKIMYATPPAGEHIIPATCSVTKHSKTQTKRATQEPTCAPETREQNGGGVPPGI
jgi:hypothetical protein